MTDPDMETLLKRAIDMMSSIEAENARLKASLNEAREVISPFAGAARRLIHFDGEDWEGMLYAARNRSPFRELLDEVDGKPISTSALHRALKLHQTLTKDQTS